MDKSVKKYLKAKRIFRREAMIRLTERHTPSDGSDLKPLTAADAKTIGDEAELLWAEAYKREQSDLKDATRVVPLAKKSGSRSS